MDYALTGSGKRYPSEKHKGVSVDFAGKSNSRSSNVDIDSDKKWMRTTRKKVPGTPAL